MRSTPTPERDDDLRLVKHSVGIAGHRTSVSLENLFWRILRDQAAARGQSVAAIVGEVDRARGAANLSSALRVHVVQTLLTRAAPTGTERIPKLES